jgi:membrane dipeptidase
MLRRALCLLCLLNAAAFAADPVARAAEKLQASIIGIDSHIDTMQRVLNEKLSIAAELANGHVDLPRLREGGMRAPFFALWVPTFYPGSEAIRRTLQLREAAERLFQKFPDQVELATSAADVERILKTKKIAVTLTLEGGHQISDDLAVLRMYYLLGIRAMTLTHFRNNNWADSSTDKPQHDGLTDFGRDVVREMNRMGMIVDISHVSDKTFYDTLEVTTRPVIASHSSCRALTDVPRNMTDDMLRALAKNGGVIGIAFAPGFVNTYDASAEMAEITRMADRESPLAGRALDDYAREEHFRDFGSPPRAVKATLQDVVDHIDHAVKVAGIDHVGIGSDFDGIGSVPKGLEDVAHMTALTAALLKKGYSEADIRKIMGLNMLRVYHQVGIH